jgi:hypothetical protein
MIELSEPYNHEEYSHPGPRPPPNYPKETYPILLAFCLVNEVCRSFAQPMLFDEVHITSEKQARLWLDGPGRHKFATTGMKLRGTYHFSNQLKDKTAVELIEASRGLTRLCLWDWSRLPASVFESKRLVGTPDVSSSRDWALMELY